MSPAVLAALLLCGLACLFHLASIGIAAVRCRARAGTRAAPADAPAVTVIRPVCGLDNFVAETLRSSLVLAYPAYEVIFCAACANDPVMPLVRTLMAAHPGANARLLIGGERISDNPKLNNCVKGWEAAAYGWIALADSNVLMPPDYLQRLLAAWRPGTGLVCAPPIGAHADGFWAHVECAFLNAYQARVQYAADTLGLGFAQGKTMLWRRPELERAGGIRALAAELAEDAAATKIVRAAGLRVRLVDAPFPQPLGRRTFGEVWRRQARWARLRRASFPLLFLPEILTGLLPPLAALAFLAQSADVSVPAACAALAVLWYGAEAALARAARWPLSPLYPLHALLRDLLLPCLWIAALVRTDFVWRGHAMSIAAGSETA